MRNSASAGIALSVLQCREAGVVAIITLLGMGNNAMGFYRVDFLPGLMAEKLSGARGRGVWVCLPDAHTYILKTVVLPPTSRIVDMMRFCRMTEENRPDAVRLIEMFLDEDEFLLDCEQVYGHGGSDRVVRATQMFLDTPALGFVWMAYEEDEPVGVCAACLAVSTSLGQLVCKMDDVFVKPDFQGRGIGGRMVSELKNELIGMGVKRVDTSYHLENDGAKRFYEKNCFIRLNEERLSCLLATK